MVSMESVYMYGRPDGQASPRPARTPPTPKKGMLRARMARELLAAHAAGAPADVDRIG